MTTRQIEKTCSDSVAASGEIASKKHTPAIKKQPTKLKHVRKTAQEEIGKRYTHILQTLAKEAAKGSVQHTKLLFDLGGVNEEVQASATARKRRPRSLGEILLKEAEAIKRRKELETQGESK
jgi:hypothetical protein